MVILSSSILLYGFWRIKQIKKGEIYMTLKDFLKRVDIEKDGDKMLLWCDYVNTKDGEVVVWSNLETEINECYIMLLPSKNNSPFSSEN